MKFNNSIFTLTLLLVTFMVACDSKEDEANYLDQFSSYNALVVEFTSKKLPQICTSPFDSLQFYPMGKMKTPDGVDISIVTYFEGPEPYGEVFAEIIHGNQRKDRLAISGNDMGYHSFARIDLPYIDVVTNTGEQGGTTKTIRYLITANAFEAQN